MLLILLVALTLGASAQPDQRGKIFSGPFGHNGVDVGASLTSAHAIVTYCDYGDDWEAVPDAPALTVPITSDYCQSSGIVGTRVPTRFPMPGDPARIYVNLTWSRLIEAYEINGPTADNVDLSAVNADTLPFCGGVMTGADGLVCNSRNWGAPILLPWADYESFWAEPWGANGPWFSSVPMPGNGNYSTMTPAYYINLVWQTTDANGYRRASYTAPLQSWDSNGLEIGMTPAWDCDVASATPPTGRFISYFAESEDLRIGSFPTMSAKYSSAGERLGWPRMASLSRNLSRMLDNKQPQAEMAMTFDYTRDHSIKIRDRKLGLYGPGILRTGYVSKPTRRIRNQWQKYGSFRCMDSPNTVDHGNRCPPGGNYNYDTLSCGSLLIATGPTILGADTSEGRWPAILSQNTALQYPTDLRTYVNDLSTSGCFGDGTTWSSARSTLMNATYSTLGELLLNGAQSRNPWGAGPFRDTTEAMLFGLGMGFGTLLVPENTPVITWTRDNQGFELTSYSLRYGELVHDPAGAIVLKTKLPKRPLHGTRQVSIDSETGAVSIGGRRLMQLDTSDAPTTETTTATPTTTTATPTTTTTTTTATPTTTTTVAPTTTVTTTTTTATPTTTGTPTTTTTVAPTTTTTAAPTITTTTTTLAPSTATPTTSSPSTSRAPTSTVTPAPAPTTATPRPRTKTRTIKQTDSLSVSMSRSQGISTTHLFSASQEVNRTHSVTMSPTRHEDSVQWSAPLAQAAVRRGFSLEALINSDPISVEKVDVTGMSIEGQIKVIRLLHTLNNLEGAGFKVQYKF